jgi:hypothetical protein
MRTSKARGTDRSEAALYRTVDGGAALSDLAARGAHYLAVVLATLLLAAVTLVFTPGSPARADTVFASGQVFASVGFSTVNVYDGTSGAQVGTPLVDSTPPVDSMGNIQYNTGSAFDSNNNLYVADDSAGAISEFSPTGAPMGQFATGLSNPDSLVFDNSGNLYVGQQTTPYIAEFSPSGQLLANIGPLNTELFGDDWIDLSSDQCTFYYTSEGTDIYTYNKCTGAQGVYNNPGSTNPNAWNQAPFTGLGAFEVRILANGDVLVADSSAVLLLDQNGNLLQTYSCGSLPGCQGLLFAVSVAPDGTSFWTGDSVSGDVWHVDLATGKVLQSFTTNPGTLYGLSVDGQLMAATAPTVIAATPATLSTPQVTGNFSSPTPVTAVLTNPTTGAAISGEPVTFTLNGNSAESCTANTDSTGTATCVITPIEIADTYSLTASFSGDTSTSTPVGSTTSSGTFTVTPDTTSLVYTGPTTAVNGQPVTLSGTLTTDNPTAGTPLSGQIVNFTLGSQTCNGSTNSSGVVSCTISPVAQTVSNVTATATYGGSPYESPSGTTPTPVLVKEPTTLTVHSATGDFADATTVSGTLTDSLDNSPIAGEPVTLTLNSLETCSATTDATGTASCSVTPSEAAATYPLTGSFTGDTGRTLELLGSGGSSNFAVTLEETSLTYTGPTIAQNGQPLALSGVLTTDDPALGSPIANRTVVFNLGTGSSQQTCVAVTDSKGNAACSIASVSQAPGPVTVTDIFPGDAFYRTASATAMVNLPEGTQLTVNPTTGVYNGSTPVSGTLTNTYTGKPVPNEPVTLTVNGSQSCNATTNAQGVATCDISPNEPAGSYTLSGSFPGDTSSTPQLLTATSSPTTFTVTQAPTSVTYTGPTTLTNGQPITLSGVVISSEPTSGTPVGGEQVTFTVGSQSCTGTSAANGDVSCTVAKVNQTSGTVTVTTSVGGNSYYQPSSTSTPASVQSPTTLTVNATTGQYGGATIVTGMLTNSATAVPVAGQTVTLTLNGTQSCTAVTGANGQASCSITPNEPAGSYTLSGSYGGNPSTTTGPSLLPSNGSNTFGVTKAPATIVNTSPTIAVNGMSITLSATVTATAGSGPGGLPVTLTLGSGSTAQSCTGTASATGAVSCTITNPNQVAGTVPVTVAIGGNFYYSTSSAATTETTASLPGTGDFVVGNLTADKTATGNPVTGTTVDFWGSQYWKNNAFSGVVNAPASMKGYIDSAPKLVCPTPNWTSDPGNSSHPPAVVPVNMVVIVGSTITQSGSTELGDVKHLVIVHTQAGYGPAPGHDGWGTIIGTVC